MLSPLARNVKFLSATLLIAGAPSNTKDMIAYTLYGIKFKWTSDTSCGPPKVSYNEIVLAHRREHSNSEEHQTIAGMISCRKPYYRERLKVVIAEEDHIIHKGMT